MELTDVTWAAGFYEGEGHLAYGKVVKVPRVQISQCNKEPLDKLANLFGGQVNGPYKVKGGNQDVYRWHLTTHSEARHFIYTIFPYLSDKLQKNTLDKIDRYADVVEVRNLTCRNGHVRTDNNVWIDKNGHKYCRECRAIQRGK